ncbi:MAG: ion transporter [Acutalibacteraceae bacterium]
MRKRIFEIIETASDGDKISTAYDLLMMIAIIASLVPLAFKTETEVFKIIDKVCVVIFIVDYFLRLITADYKYNDKSFKSFIRYPFSSMAIIDLLSILPSLTTVNGALKLLRVMRMMRMLRAVRVMRIFKFARYSKNLQTIVKVIKNSKESLVAVAALAVGYILVAALVIINIEPDSFNSFFDAIYWATVSLTTVGYGDIYPVSVIGKTFTMISSVMGIAIVALPAGIITAGFMNELEKENSSDESDIENKTK